MGARATVDDLRVVQTGKAERELLTESIAELAGDRPLRVLEAGCGQQWPIEIGGVDFHITGVDLDVDAMRIRRERHDDLDVEIVGDLRTVDLPAETFDVVYCSYVLEHIEGAEAVLDRLVAATRPGGRLVIRIPDGKSIYGFLVRHSPHRMHVWYKRYVEGFRDAGKPGHAPYPTVYDSVVSLPGLLRYADERGLEVVNLVASNAFVQNFGPLKNVMSGAMRAAARLTGGRLRGTHNNLGVVLARPAAG